MTHSNKAPFGVDLASGLVHSLVVTTAKAVDISQTENLLHGEERWYWVTAATSAPIDRWIHRRHGKDCAWSRLFME